MWSAPGINNPPMGLGMNVENTQLCPPFLNFGSEMPTARHNNSDGEKMSKDEEDPELARKRKELQEIEEQILLKKAALYLKQGSTFMDDTASCGVRDKRVAHNTPDTSGIHAFSQLSNEDGGRAFFCHEGASLRDRVKSILEQKHTVDYFTKMQLKTAKETMNSFSQSKENFKKEDHPLRRRVHEFMRRKLKNASAVPANREVAGITQAPPSQSLHPAVQESIFINKGFQRFLSVLNQGVDINLLSKIVNDDTRNLPVRDQQLNDQPAAVEKSDLSYKAKWSDKPLSHNGAQWQDHRQTNSGESKTELASREQSNKKGISKADEKKDKGDHLGSPPSNKKGISKADEKNERGGHVGSSSQSQSSPSSKKGISKADKNKWRDKPPSNIGEEWQELRHTKSAEKKTELPSREQSNKKDLSKADEKNERRGSFSPSSWPQSSLSNNKGISKVDENKDKKGHFGSSSQSQSSPSIRKGISKADEKDRRGSFSCSSPPQSSPYNKKGILKADEKEDEEGRICSRSRSRSSPAVDHLEKVDIQKEHLQNILKTLGLNLEPEEMSRLTDRTQERLYGKKIDDKQVDNSRQEQEHKQRSPKRCRSSSSSSSDIYSGLSLASSDSSDESEQGQSSDSSSSSDKPTFQESEQVQQGIHRDKDRVGFKQIPSHQPCSDSQVYSIPLSHVLANYSMAHYAQNPYLSGTYNTDINLGYTQNALSSWYYLNGYHYPQNHNALSLRASSAGSNFDSSLMVNPDLSISEGQTGMLSGPRYIRTINTQPSGDQRCLIQLTTHHKPKGKPGQKQTSRGKKRQKEKQGEEEKGAKKCKTSDSGMEVSQSTDKTVSESPVLEVKEQPTGPQQEDKRQPTGPRQEDKRQPTGPRQEDKRQPTGPRQEDKRQPTGPRQEDKRQPTGPRQEDKQQPSDLKQQREEEIKANLKRKLDVFNRMVKQRFTTARNSLT